MKSIANKCIIMLAVSVMCFGAAVSAKPMYHWTRWKVKEIRGARVWDEWRNADTPAAGGITPAFWLDIPDIDIHSLVILNPDMDNLLKYPCFLNLEKGGGAGRLGVIMAHRDMHFRKLAHIQVNDVISLERKDRRVERYKVVDTEIVASEKARPRLQEKSREDWLVLMTCYPFKYVGPAPERFLVWARREGAG